MQEKIGRNDPCPCGSGLKYKKCCALKSGMQRYKAEVLTGQSKIQSLLGRIRPLEGSNELKEKGLSENPEK